MTVSATEKTHAIFNHDVFNMFIMSIVTLLAFAYIIQNPVYNTFDSSLNTLHDKTSNVSNINSNSSQLLSNHNLFDLIWLIFASYMTIDTIWIFVIPHCVAAKSPNAVIFHHLASGMLTVLILTSHSHFNWFLPAMLLLEINTVCLAGRRQLPKTSWLYHVTDNLFHISWYICRCVWLPYLTYLIIYEWLNYSANVLGTYVNVLCMAPLLMISLTVLSWQWTYEMVVKNLLAREASSSSSSSTTTKQS